MTTKALLRSVRELGMRIPRPRIDDSHLSLQDIRKLKAHICAIVLAEQAVGRLRNLLPWQQAMLDSYEKPPKRLLESEVVKLLTPKTYEALGLSRASFGRARSNIKSTRSR
jgi:hypothetical protein